MSSSVVPKNPFAISGSAGDQMRKENVYDSVIVAKAEADSPFDLVMSPQFQSGDGKGGKK